MQISTFIYRNSNCPFFRIKIEGFREKIHRKNGNWNIQWWFLCILYSHFFLSACDAKYKIEIEKFDKIYNVHEKSRTFPTILSPCNQCFLSKFLLNILKFNFKIQKNLQELWINNNIEIWYFWKLKEFTVQLTLRHLINFSQNILIFNNYLLVVYNFHSIFFSNSFY